VEHPERRMEVERAGGGFLGRVRGGAPRAQGGEVAG
jgi:hypothetical protein